MARISSPAASPAFADGVPGIVCSTITRPGSTLTTVPKPFLLAALHLLQLLKLAGIEKNRMRIERLQHARNRALIKRDVGIHRIGRLLIDGHKHADQFLDLLGELRARIVGGKQQ